MKINANVEIDIEELAESLPYKEASELIKAIDLGQCELNFTFEMAKWFISEVIKCDIDDGGYVNDLLKMFTD